MWPIAKEICYLSHLLKVPPESLRHTLVGAKNIPAVPAGDAGIALVLNSLVVIDVSIPGAPAVSATLLTVPTGGASAVSAACEYVDTTLHLMYVVSGISPDAGNTLQVIDISDKAAPVVLGSCPATFADSEYRVAKSGNTLYVAGDQSSSVVANRNLLQVFDVSNSAAPVPLTTYNLDTGFALSNIFASEAIAQGTNLFISASDSAGGRGLLGIYNVTNPLAVTQTSLTAIRNTGIANDILCFLLDVVGNFAFVYVRTIGAGLSEVDAWDISNPAAPVLANTVAIPVIAPTTLRFSQIANNHAYGVTTAAGDHNIYPVDFTVPTALVALAPTLVAGVGNNFSIRAATSRVYLLKDSPSPSRAIRVFDATVPAALVEVGALVYSAGGSRQQLHLDTAAAAPKVLVDFEVPLNYTWVVTCVKLRSFPAAAAIPIADGDFRSDDYDLDGSAKIFWQVNGSSVTPENTVHTVSMNRPVFFAFQGGINVKLIAAELPANDPVINISINGYLVDASGLETLNPNLTNIYATALP